MYLKVCATCGRRVQMNRWRKNGAALAKVVAALLQFGKGLRLGPDADGLLNFGDTEREVRGWPAPDGPSIPAT